MSVLDQTSAHDARRDFTWEQMWALFDGDESRLNIAHECLDRHDPDGVCARIGFADGRRVELTFGELSRSTARFAHMLEHLGIRAGQPIGVMMEPSKEFYTAVFGALKLGAVVVPLYTLFGPDAIRDRLDDCGAEVVIVDVDADIRVRGLGYRVVRYDADLAALVAEQPPSYEVTTAGTDPAVLQYTSGTTRQLPEAVPHDHRSVVTLARAGLYALGLQRRDRFFCPSSPAWGHGLWHGTVAPWSLGVAVGAYSGRFEITRLADVLRDFEITNLAAASTIYRMLLASGEAGRLPTLAKASYTGEELAASAQEAFLAAAGIPVCGMYGTTETGVILGNYPGFADYTPRAGALGTPLPGCDVAVLTPTGGTMATGKTGEISVRRRGRWFGAKDLGSVDADGFFYYAGRADDVIISGGWTISPLEVERTIASHPAVDDVAVVGVADGLRGLIVKAFVVAHDGSPDLAGELQQLVRTQLSPHEYPREVEFVTSLPKTPNGKLDRRALRAAGDR